MSASEAGMFDASIAFDGWVGALLGAVASILVAVWVLRRTLRHDREQFVEQQRAERQAFLEQAEHARALAIDQERMHAFAGLAAELMRAEDRIGTDIRSIEDAFLPVVSAYHRWTLYIPDADDEFVRGVNRGIGTVRETAMTAVRKAQEAARDPGDVDGRAVSAYFDAHGGGEDIHWIIRNGRAWHLHLDQRSDLDGAARERFPPRLSIDLETGEDRMV